MPLVYPFPFPSETARDPVEMFRYARNVFGRDQKWRAGQFTFPGGTSVAATTITQVTLTDTSVGGTSTGIDNTVPGMWVSVSPPATVDANLQVGYAFAPAAGKLTVQLINNTAAPIAVSGTWAYVGYTF